MGDLQIYLFGSVHIVYGDLAYEAKVTPTILSLLAYLLIHRHQRHHRDVLAGLFWGDYSDDRARSCLSTALWRLRRVLEPAGSSPGGYLVTTPIGEVGFNPDSNYWLDIAVFEKQINQLVGKSFLDLDSNQVQELERTLQLYTGDLLQGFYDDWALRERERLHLMYVNSLAYLMYYYRSNHNFDKCLAYGLQILNCDPLREEIHYEMMRLYLESGQRAQAVRQYEICRQILMTELGIPPRDETRLLYSQIVEQNSDYLQQPKNRFESASLQDGLRQLRLATENFDQARRRLQQAVQMLEHLTSRRE